MLAGAAGRGERVSIGREGGDVVISTARLDRVLEHEAGDLTAIVEAGVRVRDLNDRLAEHGQMLALDPPGNPTIGACIAANLSGPRRHRYGTARDLVIGVTVVLADGTIASSGGKVVKNVAGYDLQAVRGRRASRTGSPGCAEVAPCRRLRGRWPYRLPPRRTGRPGRAILRLRGAVGRRPALAGMLAALFEGGAWVGQPRSFARSSAGRTTARCGPSSGRSRRLRSLMRSPRRAGRRSRGADAAVVRAGRRRVRAGAGHRSRDPAEIDLPSASAPG